MTPGEDTKISSVTGKGLTAKLHRPWGTLFIELHFQSNMWSYWQGDALQPPDGFVSQSSHKQRVCSLRASDSQTIELSLSLTDSAFKSFQKCFRSCSARACPLAQPVGERQWHLVSSPRASSTLLLLEEFLPGPHQDEGQRSPGPDLLKQAQRGGEQGLLLNKTSFGRYTDQESLVTC